jgi:CBS domain-containing protein
MKVADVMTRGIDFVDSTATVQDAATRMAELDVGAVLIGSDEAVVGILTDRDILVRVVVEGKNSAYVTVNEVMTKDVVGCDAEDAIETVFAKMREGQFRRMPVFDEEGVTLGVVTLSDLARHIDSPENLTEALRELSEPHRRPEVEPAADDTAEAAENDDAEPPKAVRA